MELINIIINSVIAIGTVVAIIITWKSANRNTQKQIYNSNKQSARPYLSITNCSIITVKTKNSGFPVEFDEFSKANIQNKLEGKNCVKNDKWIELTFKNNGYGIARLTGAYDVNKEIPITYEDNIEDGKIVMRDDSYIDIAVGEERKIFLEVNYIKEKPNHSLLEKPISDQCEIAFFYKDLNDNYYSNDIVFNVLYMDEKSKELKKEIYYLEFSQIKVLDHYFGVFYETKDKDSHFSKWLKRFSKK